MSRNHKLTSIIRNVESATAEPEKLSIRFDDQSTITVKTVGTAAIFPPGGKIKVVQEDGAALTLQFEDGSSATIRLADPSSSVGLATGITAWSISGDQFPPVQICRNGESRAT